MECFFENSRVITVDLLHYLVADDVGKKAKNEAVWQCLVGTGHVFNYRNMGYYIKEIALQVSAIRSTLIKIGAILLCHTDYSMVSVEMFLSIILNFY